MHTIPNARESSWKLVVTPGLLGCGNIRVFCGKDKSQEIAWVV